MNILIINCTIFSISILVNFLKNKIFFKGENYSSIFTYTIFYLLIFTYLLSYFDLLKNLHYFLYFIGTTIFLYNFKILINKENIKYLILINLFLLISYNFEFLWWDEFSSWGLRTKEIFLHQSIYYDRIATNLSKPSGSNLIHYIFMGNVEFKENIIIFSHFIIIFFIIKSIFDDVSQKDKKINFLLFFSTIYFISFNLNYGLFSIYTGLLTSLIFVKLILILIEIESNYNNYIFKKDLFKIFPLVFLLILIKDFSLFYIIYLICLSFLYFIIYKNKQDFFKLLIITSSFILSYIFLNLLNIAQGIDVQSTSININKLLKIIFSLKLNISDFIDIGIFQAELFRIPNRVIEIFTDNPKTLPSTKILLHHWLLALILFSFFIIRNIKKNTKRLNILIIFLFFGLLLHLVLLLTSYQIFFGPSEAITLASFGRYMGLYIMPYLIVLFSVFYKFNRKNYGIKILLIILLFIISPGKSIEILIPKNTLNLNTNYDDIKNKKKQIIKITNFINLDNDSKKRIYILIDGDDGYYHNFFKLYLYPKYINLQCWSYTKVILYQNFNFNCNYKNDSDIEAELNEYNYIINYGNHKKYNEVIEKFKKFNIINNNLENVSIYKKIQ